MAMSKKVQDALKQKKSINLPSILALLAELAKDAPSIAAAVEALISIFSSTPTPPAPAPTVKALTDSCPVPDGGDALCCMHAAQHHILCAAMCCECHCKDGNSCDCDECVRCTVYHLGKALECLAAPCCK